jgi:hypothetical protein
VLTVGVVHIQVSDDNEETEYSDGEEAKDSELGEEEAIALAMELLDDSVLAVSEVEIQVSDDNEGVAPGVDEPYTTGVEDAAADSVLPPTGETQVSDDEAATLRVDELNEPYATGLEKDTADVVVPLTGETQVSEDEAAALGVDELNSTGLEVAEALY